MYTLRIVRPGLTGLALVLLKPADRCALETTFLKMIRATPRTTLVIVIQAKVRILQNPRQHTVVELLGYINIFTVVLFHDLPRGLIAGHAVNPQLMPLMGHLADTQETVGHII